MNATQSRSGVLNEAGPVKRASEVCVHFFSFNLFDMTPLEPSEIVRAEDDTLPLSIRRTRRVNRRLPKRFRDMLPEPPLPLPPQDAEVFLEVNPLQANSGSPSTTAAIPVPISQPSSQADLATPQLAPLPSKRRGVFATQKNSFGLFRLFDDDSIPINDPEDQSGADPLPTLRIGAPVSQPLPTDPANLFHPYPNESSWRIGDWYWNQGAQKSKQNFKSLLGIISSSDFRPEDLCHTNWTSIDRQLGSLGTTYFYSQEMLTATDLQEWQDVDGGWMWRNISISVPFPRRSLHPGPRSYTISNFYRRSLLSIIREVVLDPVRCKSFHFEPYSLRWQRSCGSVDVGVHGELFSSEAFATAHRDLQGACLGSIGCTLPRRVVALMFWSDATQLTAFGDAKLWPLYVYFGNKSKYRHCMPTTNLCSHAAYFQAVRGLYLAIIEV